MVTKKDKHLATAQKYLERGSLEKALTEFQNAVKEDAKDTRTWLRMAEVHVRLGQNDKATEVYQKTVDLYVEQAPAEPKHVAGMRPLEEEFAGEFVVFLVEGAAGDEDADGLHDRV